MKKWIIILLTIFITIFFTPYNVQASSNEEASYKSNKEVEQLYDYITNMKSEHELMKDMDIKNYVNNYMKKGKVNFQ